MSLRREPFATKSFLPQAQDPGAPKRYRAPRAPVVRRRPELERLNERWREIFRQIVESYLATGEPVGSRNLARVLPMTLSPASVRNVMGSAPGSHLKNTHLGGPAAQRGPN